MFLFECVDVSVRVNGCEILKVIQVMPLVLVMSL